MAKRGPDPKYYRHTNPLAHIQTHRKIHIHLGLFELMVSLILSNQNPNPNYMSGESIMIVKIVTALHCFNLILRTFVGKNHYPVPRDIGLKFRNRSLALNRI